MTKDLVSSHLKSMGITPLTPEQKEAYRLKMQAYLKKRRKTKEEMVDLQEDISQLEERLMQNIPTLFGAEYVHVGSAGCGFKAVFPLPREKKHKETYYCAFCEQYFQLEADGPHRINTTGPLVSE